LVCSGKRTALFHGPTSKKKIKNNEIVYLDLGAQYRGWCSDMTRTFFIGTPSRKLENIYQILLRTQLKQLGLVKAGAKVADIDLAGRNYLKKFKLDTYFIHTTGHGVGKKIHQKPKISYKSHATLKIGDVVTIEPGVYIKGLGGVRIEDLVIVTKNGCINLTKSSKKMIVL
jgi:Xaa-Pro aminopeptidase